MVSYQAHCADNARIKFREDSREEGKDIDASDFFRTMTNVE